MESPETQAQDAVAMSKLVLASAPRPDALCRPYVRLLAPPIAWIVYGALWCVLSLVALGVFGLGGGEIGELLGARSHTQDTLVLVFAWVGAGLIWIPYVWFMRRRLRRALVLVRDGQFVVAKALDAAIPGDIAITGSDSLNGMANPDRRPRLWYRVAIEHEGKTFHARCPYADGPVPGTEGLVLFHPSSRYVLAFTYRNAPTVCRIDRA